MFIGEAPGASEDATGEAFVGRAGALLDELLSEAGVEKFLIVNVLKCRPPNNKFPGDHESHHAASVVEQCLPWLDQQLEVVAPKVIILVGGKAAASTVYRGRPMPKVGELVHKRILSEDYPGIDIFGMYHTSYMLRLRNQDREQYDQIRERTLSILQVAQKIIDGESSGMAPTRVARRPDKGEQLSFF
jgi:DNA polymerase